MSLHFVFQVAMVFLIWTLLAVAVGLSIGPVMREDRRLFGFLVSATQKNRLFGFNVPKNIKRA